ncbi:MAG: tRNA (adenosine(37)-N6)-threonylcarbamoyltransferase complex ATPase subunit type 1 TsaE [Ruminococcaceae bacterium]|nr:tRNA (adenosine(37)-N6)-threonylcarbamoyltransferase complex ATPase subunit type 1 TsaE [Oscillospiraceae bacterium]
MQKIEYGKAASIHSSSAFETEELGKECALSLLSSKNAPRFVALYGDLGVGKTAFIRGFTSVISPDSKVKSPTFAIVHEYKGKPLSIFHFDMYRITNEDELWSIGFYDYLDRNGICLVEWSENIPFALPDRYLRVEIIKDNESNTDSRLITLSPIGY